MGQQTAHSIPSTKAPVRLVHIDDWITSAVNDTDPSVRYAAWFFFLCRVPANFRASFSEFVPKQKLFCTYQGAKYRVTGASRLGDIWIQSNVERVNGYDKRVYANQCGNWSNQPDGPYLQGA